MERTILERAQHHCKMCYEIGKATREYEMNFLKTVIFWGYSMLSRTIAVQNLRRSNIDQRKKDYLVEECLKCREGGRNKREIERFLLQRPVRWLYRSQEFGY